MFELHKKYIILTLLLLVIEILIAVLVHDDFIRPHIGDLLVVILIYCFLKSFLNISVLTAAICVLLFSYLIELLQYFKIADILGLEHGSVLYVITGNSFSWTDMIIYPTGLLLIIIIEIITGNSLKSTL
jgi:hypothetical protein